MTILAITLTGAAAATLGFAAGWRASDRAGEASLRRLSRRLDDAARRDS